MYAPGTLSEVEVNPHGPSARLCLGALETWPLVHPVPPFHAPSNVHGPPLEEEPNERKEMTLFEAKDSHNWKAVHRENPHSLPTGET